MFTPVEQPIDTIEQELIACERLIGRLRARQLELLRAIDHAQVPHGDGSRSLREWTAGRLDIAPETASSLSRAVRLIGETSAVADQLAAGDITFDRAVAVAKLAASGVSEELLSDTDRHDIAGITRLAARHRRITPRHERDAHASRHLAFQPQLDGLSGRFWGELSGIGFATVEKALMQRSDELPDSPDTEGRGTRLADALIAIAQDSLDGDGSQAKTAPQATIFVDADLAAPSRGEAGAEIAAGPRVGPATLEQLLCDGLINVVGVQEGRPISVTTSRRAIPPAIRAFVLHRDGGCTVEGCSSRYRLQPHHIVPWSLGGSHDADNLTTVCWYHHHVVIHGRGYCLDPDSPSQRRRLLPPARGPDPP